MAITKKPTIEADSTTFGYSDVGVPGDYPINGCQINDIGKHLQQLEKSIMDLMLKSDENKKMKMVCGSCYYPKNNPAKPLGEDAHFICEEEQTIGVADGVGGWAKKGVDAGEFARELMSNACLSVRNSCQERKAVDDTDTDIIGAIDPRKVLEEAYANTKENLALLGSSTACIISFDKHRGVLNAANVGDSGFMLCRDSKVVMMSETMQHRFNCPYQLGNGGSINDGPESAQEYQFEKILPGDIIVIGTDGLLDNMYPEDIEDALQYIADWRANHNNITDRGYCALVAEFIAKLALMNSMDEAFESPFSKEAEKAGLQLIGGKADDITVIVAQVVV